MSVGIDLGTTLSVVAYYDETKGISRIISNENGNSLTPSFVSFTENERLIGDDAKRMCTHNVKNTIFDIKRLIGRKWSTVQDEIKRLPYTILQGPNDSILVEVLWKNEKKTFTPEEISAMILGKMKQIAELHLGHTVKDAVITIPAYFNDAQRKATELAGKIAGLNVLRIINEPTASALAYGLNNDEKGNVLVFDFGGGTLDVTVLTLKSGIFEVKSTAGDSHLGGVDLDEELAKYVISNLTTKMNVSITDKLKRKILNESEQVKKRLSNGLIAKFELEVNDSPYVFNISRQVFEKLCNSYFKTCIDVLDKAVLDSKIDKKDIHRVVLVGGSSRIPKIRDMITDYFGKNILCHGINPDEAVAYGASVQAAKLSGEESLTGITLVDVTPLSLGIEASGGVMSVIIPRNTTIPKEVTKVFSTKEDNQPSVTIKVFEGERVKTEDNNLLGKFDLIGLPKGKKGHVQIPVTFKLDDNGILTVSAEEMTTGKKNNIVIESKNKVSNEEVLKMISDAEKYKEEDNKYRSHVIAVSKLNDYIEHVSAFLETASRITDEEKETGCKLVNNVLDSINTKTMTTSEYETTRVELETYFTPIIKRVYSQQ